MILTKFHENRLIIDGEINEKHALLVSCGLRYISIFILLVQESTLESDILRC